jgi:hypothetical protein
MLTDTEEIFYAEDGSRTPAVELDWDSIDRNCFRYCDPQGMDLDRASKAIRQIVSWIFQDGPKNETGVFIRATICAWVFLPEYQRFTETEMAGNLEKHKQSIGRWAEVFKRDFPSVRTPHLRR